MFKLIKCLFKAKQIKIGYEIVVATKPDSVDAECFRRIPMEISFSSVDKEPKVIQVTSSLAGEHKTTTSANLAAVYKEIGKNVVIVDCDLRRPKTHRVFEVINEKGLSNYLIDRAEYCDLIKKGKYLIDVINAGEKVSFPHSILRSDKFNDLINRLRVEYDYVILDCPPVLPVTDSLIISGLADTTLFVVNQKKSLKNDTLEAIKMLKDVGANLGGVILSDVKKVNKERYSDYI